VLLRLEDNIKLDLREIGCEDRRWIELAQDYVQWWAVVLCSIARVLITIIYM
jgi:hypothetical protein